MGYDLHITRQENWFDDDRGRQITLEEWKQYVASDNEMRLDNYAEATTTDGETIWTACEGLSVWLGYSENGRDGNYAWFNYSRGNIDVKNPDDEIIKKMLQIAAKLNAIVQGDDGEIYEFNIDGSIWNSSMPVTTDKAKRPWWKFW